jgi:hypothetical protein
MNYTKYLKGPLKKHNKYSLEHKDEKVEMSMNILKDIKKTSYILRNYNKIENKFNLDEFFTYFLQDKNSFLNGFKIYIDNSDTNKVNM